jgi:methyl-accepting chemotaxis protein
MPSRPSPTPGDGRGAWRGLRRRVATLTGILLLALGTVQLAAWTLLHPDLTGRQLAWMSALLVAAAGLAALLASLLAGSALRPLSRVRLAASALADGRPPPRLDLGLADGEVGDLARQLEELGETVHLLRRELRTSADRLAQEARGLAGGVARSGASTASQVEALRQATAIAATIADASREAAAEAESVLETTQRAQALSGEGLGAAAQAVRTAGALGEQVRRIASTMEGLSERTLHVGEVVASVKDLAEQSNLLALNASIEAAKAGEHGRGFAAVAMEMRNLAEQSRQAAVQVRAILGEIQKHAREAAHATEEGSSRAELATGRSRSAGESIEGLALVLDGSAASVRAIAGRSRRQAASAADLEAALADLGAATRGAAADSAALEARAAELTALAGGLSALAERLRG